MKTINHFVILICLGTCLCCNVDPETDPEIVTGRDTITLTEVDSIFKDYRGYLSETDFKTALIGKWQSAFNSPGKKYINSLELTIDGEADILINQESVKEEYKGSYKVGFNRPISEGMYTIATINITTLDTIIELSRVSFDEHNGVLHRISANPFLRNDESPYGVLEKIE